MEHIDQTYDVTVIGAGHAGIEAALACARLHCNTVVFTINADWIGNMPCNPSIGGTSKGHLVREIDALGGEMGKAADKNMLQARMLNLGKGPAVHSPRMQIDRRAYSAYMKNALESQEGLDVRQCEIVSLSYENGTWTAVTKLGGTYHSKCVVLATGTFLAGRVYVGDVSYESGPDGMFPANELARSLRTLGLPSRRFKTGTPSRVNARSVDVSSLEQQEGDENIVPFSFETDPKELKNTASCYITYTNENTKKIILENLSRSPLYSGKIEGVGPRYCPSIEDKIVRFSDKKRHQVFIEPCGANTKELYLQGLSSSLPEDVQLSLMKTIPGLENVKVIRNAYAIEYDCIDPTALRTSLEFRDFPGLFGAGQFNGSSGYEEAAAQGLYAGINAAMKALGKEPFILDRASSYIGTLVDDLVTKGCSDPYRMMTSRSEYRLVLRQDNADIRLTARGYDIGLISKERYDKLIKKCDLINKEKTRIDSVTIPPSEALNSLLVSRETSPTDTGTKLKELIRRPQLTYKLLAPFDTSRPDLPDDVCEQVETDIKYEGYIRRQQALIDEMRRLERRKLPEDLDYSKITGLRLEAAEKLGKIHPDNIGRAGRISGVSPADIEVLLIYLEKEHL